MNNDVRPSIALVTRNRPDSLRRCLESLRAQSEQPCEVIVSDDSNDEFAAETRNIAAFFDCRWVAGPRRGLYANRNFAALQCTGTHIRTMDDDHTFPAGHFEQCLTAVRSDPHAIWTTGEVSFVDGKYYGKAETAAQLHHSGMGGPINDPDDNWAISDGSTIYPRSVFDRGFRMVEEFGFGSNYLEFGAYVYRAGFRSRCVPGAVVEHHAGRATLERGGSPAVVASWMFASLCFNLHFKPDMIRAAKYVLANLMHSKQRLPLLAALPGMIVRVRDRWTAPCMNREPNETAENPAQRYDGWHRRVHGDESPGILCLEQWHRDALAVAPPLAGTQVLEVGCGAGDFATYLAGEGADVTAVDFSHTAIEIANTRMAANKVQVRFSTADAQDLPFAAETFDVVFSCECLEHLPDPQQALREMARVLRRGGRLVLTTENYSNAMVLAWIVSWWRGVPFNSGTQVQPVERFFLFWNVRRMMRRAGFEVNRMTGAHHVFLLLPGLHPHTFVRERFRSRFWRTVFKPLARHITFAATKTK